MSTRSPAGLRRSSLWAPALFARRPGRRDARPWFGRGPTVGTVADGCASCSTSRGRQDPACSATDGKAPHTMMRMVPDQRVNRTRASRAYARFARWLTMPPSPWLRAGTRLSSRRGGSGRPAARPQAMRQAPGAALVTALGTVTRPKNLAVALRALRFDFSGAPPVLGERGGQRSCSSLVWLGGGSGRWRRRRSRDGVQTTRVGRKGCRGDDVPRWDLGSRGLVELAWPVSKLLSAVFRWSSPRSNSSWFVQRVGE